jgi:hypothetical protein
MHWLWKPENSEKPFSVCDFTAHICAFCVCVCVCVYFPAHVKQLEPEPKWML